MPSRILKESICTSESLAYLSAEAEVLFYRLIVKADDFGLYYGSPKILASLLFPLNVPTEKKVSSWLAELVNGGLVATYRAEDGRHYARRKLEVANKSAGRAWGEDGYGDEYLSLLIPDVIREMAFSAYCDKRSAENLAARKAVS